MRNKTYGFPYGHSSSFSIAVKLFINELKKFLPRELLAQAFIISKPYIMINPLHNWWLNVYRVSKFFYVTFPVLKTPLHSQRIFVITF